MPASLLSLLGGLLRIAPFLICFALGWTVKDTLVDLRDARQQVAEQEVAKEKFAEFEKERQAAEAKYRKLERELRNAQCTRVLSDCSQQYLDKLFAQ